MNDITTTNGHSMVAAPEDWRLADAFAKSGFFKDTRDVAQAIVKIQAGKELGFGPMASMQGIHVISGKVALSANILGAAVKRSGKYDYRVREMSDAAVEIEFFQYGESIGVSRFTMDDAKKAGVLGNQTWQKFARNMLFARALSNGAKWFCPDAFGGPLYTPEELGAEVDEDGDPLRVSTASYRGVEPSPELPAPETKSNGHGAPSRPWDAPTVVEAVTKKAAILAAPDKLPGEESTPNQRQQIAIRMGEIFGDAVKYYKPLVTRTLFGVDSTVELTEAQGAAYLGWLKSGDEVGDEALAVAVLGEEIAAATAPPNEAPGQVEEPVSEAA